MAPSRTLLLTNDDGIDAPGIAALFRAAEGLGQRTVVAPSGPYSECSHAVTTKKPLAIEHGADGRISIKGTPADCVRVALSGQLAEGASWVLSGVNAGGNLGTDVFHSGTVAAAREAVIRGCPAIALSHYIARGRLIDWDRAETWAARVLRELVDRPWEPGTFWNVNLPHPAADAPEPEIVECPLDPSPLPISYEFQSDGRAAVYRGDYQARLRVPGRDVAVCFGGQIALTLIRLF